MCPKGQGLCGKQAHVGQDLGSWPKMGFSWCLHTQIKMGVHGEVGMNGCVSSELEIPVLTDCCVCAGENTFKNGSGRDKMGQAAIAV